MKSIHINMEKLKRKFKPILPVQSIAYNNEDNLLSFQQIFVRIQVCIRLSADVPFMYNTIDGVKYKNHFPHVLIKMPGAKIQTISPIKAEYFYFTYSNEQCETLKALGMFNGDPVWDFEINPVITHLIHQLTGALEHSNEYGISDRIDQLSHQLYQELILARDIQKFKMNPVETKILQLTSYLQFHFNEDIEYEMLARKYGFSRRSLFRHWKLYYNKTPAKYVFELKMKEAERLLLETGKSVGEITQELNYQGDAYFCAAFKKYSGFTPLQFRKK